MKTSEIREQFLGFFEQCEHTRVASSPLIPGNDQTLLFTNAGMVQFKDVFLGKEQSKYQRAVSSQRCLRAGGKHNDLENVGYTARHHTFFEMLGNFSFGDYFKREAIHYAWKLLTKDFALPKEKLWVTVFEEDAESEKIWLQEIGVDARRFSRIGAADNFWSMGDVGPCGPCTEIFYDHGASVAGGPPGSAEQDGDRFVEIWNLVFMQYERLQGGETIPLQKPSVDTGMGLERMAAVLQGVSSNYDTDMFRTIIQTTAKTIDYRGDLTVPSLRVIADHIRACSFLVLDGVIPSNEDRGYVLRRIIRRAARHGHKLGSHHPFFYKLVDVVCHTMRAVYPQLVSQQARIADVLRKEEERFAETLENGLGILESALAKSNATTIAGDLVFKLYDTYGFPVDLTQDIARERGLALDMDGFERLMQAQRERARALDQFGQFEQVHSMAGERSVFSGYEKAQDVGTVCRLFAQEDAVDSLQEGQQGSVVLDTTPFYAESGGQVGDVGYLVGKTGRFRVTDTQKQAQVHRHLGRVEEGTISTGDLLEARIDVERRGRIVLNHSATHLLHAALRQRFGDTVQQKGSLVDADHLRFDFSHDQALTQEDLDVIEQVVNEQIRLNHKAESETMLKDQALARGAIALFGEKYEDEVRTMKMGEFSMELCGGTHVSRTGDIGLFKIVSESGVAAGVRRIEAITGEAAVQFVMKQATQMKEICRTLNIEEAHAAGKIAQLLKKNRELEKRVQDYQVQMVGQQQPGNDLASRAVKVNGLNVLATRIADADRKVLRTVMDQLKAQLGQAAIVLVSSKDKKVQIVAGVTSEYSNRLPASRLVNMVAEQVGGKGGGKRPDIAEAGGMDSPILDSVLADIPNWVSQQIE